MLAVGDNVIVEWTWGGNRFRAAGVVAKVTGNTIKVRLTEHAGEHFAPGFIVTAKKQNVHKEGNMRTTNRRVMNAPRMDSFTRAYFETALWSSTDESRDDGGDPLDQNYDIGDIAPETRDKMIADCADFQEQYSDLLLAAENIDSERAGHNFWLSRNGHGAGFFDDDLDELQEAAKSYGEFNLYVGDDGMIHGTPLDGVRAQESRRGPQSRRVADFNTLDDLIDHAARDLGATHVTGAGPETKLYFPRGGTHPYEEARVWRKGGYWHAEGPGARTGVKRLPAGAQPIGGRAGRRAAEVHDRPETSWEKWKRAVINDLEREVPRLEATRIFDRYRHEMAVRFRNGENPSDVAHNFLNVWRNEPPHMRASSVRDYEAVDNRNRRIAGPFKGYSDAKKAAGPGGHVKYVHPRRASEPAHRFRPDSTEQANAAGNKAAVAQLQSAHFDEWVRNQLIEAREMEKKDPDSVIPLKTSEDARRVARNMLQQLEWDMKQQGAAQEELGPEATREEIDEFYRGAHKAFVDSTSWLADEVLYLRREIIGGETGSKRKRPKAKRSARKARRR